MFRSVSRRGRWNWVWVFLVLAGCTQNSPGPDRFELTGTVTYQGQLVPSGEISFVPDNEQGNTGPQAIANISNGKYTLSRSHGVVGGPHLVTITGFTSAPSSEVIPPPDFKPLFRPWNTRQDFPRGDSQCDFVIP